MDDVSAWINKSRALEEKAKAEARAKALKAAQALEEQVQASHDVGLESNLALSNKTCIPLQLYMLGSWCS